MTMMDGFCPHCLTVHGPGIFCPAAERAREREAVAREQADRAEEVEIARWQWSRDLGRRLLAAERLDRVLGMTHRCERSYLACTRCRGTGKGGWTLDGERVNCDRCVGTGVEPA